MAIRTNPGAVQEALGDDYDTDKRPSLQGRIVWANLITDRLNTLATAQGTTIGSSTLEMIERLLAAYAYTQSDRLYTSRSNTGASGSFLVDKDNPYLKMAKEVDPSGLLGEAMASKRANFFWAGKAPSEQIDYQDRD